MSATKPQPEEQDRLIREKTQQLFEDDEAPLETGLHKTFKEYLRETPAAPVPAWINAALWAAGVLVLLLLLAALLRSGRSKTPPATPAATGAVEAPGGRPWQGVRIAENEKPGINSIMCIFTHGIRNSWFGCAIPCSGRSAQVPNSGRRAESWA